MRWQIKLFEYLRVEYISGSVSIHSRTVEQIVVD